MKRILLCIMLLISCASAPGTTNVSRRIQEYIKWKMTKASTAQPQDRRIQTDAVFDFDEIARRIHEESKARTVMRPMPKSMARQAAYMLATTSPNSAEVKIKDVETHSQPGVTVVLVRFRTIPLDTNLSPEVKEQIRLLYRMDPNAGAQFARKRPSLPREALSSADTFIEFMEREAKTRTATHEYEFTVDEKTGLVVDWKILQQEGRPRKSVFVGVIDNVESAKRRGH